MRGIISHRAFLPSALALLIVVVFVRVFDAGFVLWDDPQLVTENPLIRSFHPGIFRSFDPELYIPFTLLSYQVEHALFGLDPFFFHLTNLVLHAANAFLVFWLLARLLQDRTFAFLGALLFAVHPVQTEAVAWISARKDLLSAFFFLLSLHFYCKGGTKHSRNSILGIVFFACALLSKVTVIVLPFVLVLVDLWNGRKISESSLREKWPYGVLAVVFGAIAVFGKAHSLSQLTMGGTILLSIKSLGFSILKIVWPSGLSVIYNQPEALTLPEALPYAATVLAAFGAIAWMSRRDLRPILASGIFLIAYVPSFLTFWKAGDLYFFSDRYAYLPMIGAVLLLAYAAERVARKRNLQKECVAALIILCAVFGFLSYRRSIVWRDTALLLNDALIKYPESNVAHNNLGKLYLDAGDLMRAKAHFQSAVAINPSFAYPYSNLGLIELMEGDTAAALDHLEHAVALDPGFADAYVNLGVWYGKNADYDKAEEMLRTAIDLDPDLAQAHFNLGGVFYMRGDMENARESYEQALAIDPGHANAAAMLRKITDDAL